MCFLLVAGCSPKQPPVYQLIQSYQKGKHDAVVELAEKLIAENPDDAQAHRFLVKSALATGRLGEYGNRYQEYVQANPATAGYHFGLGYIHTQSQDFDAAIPELQKAVELNPDIEYVHYVLGWIHLFSGYEKADDATGLAEWEKEEQMNPRSLGALQVYNDRADYYLRIGNSEAAEKDYEKITLYAFAPGDITAARNFMVRIQSLRDEMARLEAEVESKPDDPRAYFELGVMQYKNSKVDEAIGTWLKAVELDPDNAELQNYLGKALLEKGNFADASDHLRRVTELEPAIETAYYNLAFAEENLGRTEMAIEHYRKYVELNPMAPRINEVEQKIATLEEQVGAGKEG
jgi:tetratricopeptide (TPR) repeat protein